MGGRIVAAVGGSLPFRWRPKGWGNDVDSVIHVPHGQAGLTWRFVILTQSEGAESVEPPFRGLSDYH